MDPGARRFLWNCILEMIRGGQSVVLTSHSMEECEALCTRLAIMVNGTFKCHGSIQHLKSRFGSGYTLTLRCAGDSETCRELANFVQGHLKDAVLKDMQLNQLQFHLPLKTTKLPTIFSLMESARNQHHLQLEDYSISQMTLDEVKYVSYFKVECSGQNLMCW
jgi:ABC-type multidrug transport system ATPase subunit